MAFLRVVASDAGPVIRAGAVHLRTPVLGDYPAWAQLRDESRSFLQPWEPIWPADDLDRAAFRRRIRRYQREMREDQGYPFFLFHAADDSLLGGLTVANIRRGVAQTCSVGYWMGRPHAGRGHMTAAVRAILPFLFGTLKLHRVEAACLSHNTASVRVLEKAGFRREGEARGYLCIAGLWQDHVLYARLAEDGSGPTRAASDAFGGARA